MKIRIVGTRAGCSQVIDALALVLDLIRVSEAYPSRRPGSLLVRVYIDARSRTKGVIW